MNRAQTQIETLGFFKFDFLNPGKTELLFKLYESNFSELNNRGMAVSHNQGDVQKNIAISNEIQKMVSKELEEQFPDYHFFLAHFATKKAGNEQNFQLHKDWNIVDETQSESMQIWVPLQLSYPENGGMCFVPRSQHWQTGLRSGSFGIPRIPITPECYPYLSYLRLFPGQAVVFYNSLLHGSFSNATTEDRVSMLINVVKKQQNTCYHHYNETTGNTEVYAIDAETLITNLPELEKGKMPLQLAPIQIHQTPAQYNEAISMDKLIDWIKEDRASINLKQDYEFKQYHIIKDKELEKQINHKGYAVINLLGEDEVNTLKSGFTQYFPDRNQFNGRYSSMDNKQAIDRKKIHLFIQNAIDKKLRLFFDHYYSPISILYSKRADGVSDTDWHTDPHFIFNQHLEPLYAIWCPLIEVNNTNGVLNVIPESHRFINEIRHPLIPWVLEKYRRQLDFAGISFNLQPGEAIIYDARLIHSSPPNNSAEERDCFVMRIHHNQSSYFSMHIDENIANADIFKQDESIFYDPSATNHNLKASGGELAGHMVLFKKELDRNYRGLIEAGEIKEVR